MVYDIVLIGYVLECEHFFLLQRLKAGQPVPDRLHGGQDRGLRPGHQARPREEGVSHGLNVRKLY